MYVMKIVWLYVLLANVLALSACNQPPMQHASVPKTCKIGAYSFAEIGALQKSGYEDLTSAKVNELALLFLPCVGSSNPDIRDGMVYASLSSLLRGKRLEPSTQNQVLVHLLSALDGPPDGGGFLKPFAALNISELARADRITPYLSTDMRVHLVASTTSYLTNIADYRGYNDHEGWRHGVAHSADIVLQLSLNPNINDTQLTALRSAIGAQIVPQGGHTYIYGETERLARPILYMIAQGRFSADNWNSWLAEVSGPSPLASWEDVYSSEIGLAKLHNTKAFLNVLYINANESKNENIKQILPAVRKALTSLP